MANNFSQNWGNVGNSISSGIQTLGALVAPSATPEMIDQQAQATAQAAKPRAKASSSSQDGSGLPAMPSPSDDPVKFANTQILLSIIPMMAQHAQEAYAQTGKVPDATDAFTSTHAAVLGALANRAQQNQSQGNQPNQPQPTITPPQGAMTQSGFDPETGNIQEAGWVNRGIQGLAQGGVLGMLAGMSGPTAGQRMGATAQAQKVSGKERIQPVQKSEIEYQKALTGQTQASTTLAQQEISGTKKMQPADIYAAQAAAFQKRIESKKTSLEAEKANLLTLTKTQGDIIGHPTTMLMGAQGLKDIHQAISDSMERIKTLSQDIEADSNAYAQGVGLNSTPAATEPVPEG